VNLLKIGLEKPLVIDSVSGVSRVTWLPDPSVTFSGEKLAWTTVNSILRVPNFAHTIISGNQSRGK